MRKIIFFIVLIGGLVLTGCRQTKKIAASSDEGKIVASTSWTAAFADIAGAEQVKIHYRTSL